MQNQSLKLKILNFEFWFLVFSFSLLVILSWSLCGCSVWRRFKPEEAPYEKLSAGYNLTRLKTSSSHDVMRIIRTTKNVLGPRFTGTHLLSHSETAIASVGQSKNGYKSWFTMVAFDESDMTAKRKYFYLVDEKAVLTPANLRNFQILPKHGLIFDSQLVLSTELLGKGYATEEARQIVILKQVAESLRNDIDELSQDNQTLAISGMLMNQVLKAVLLELDKTPVLAKNLSDKSGVAFTHISFDKGRIGVIVDESIVTVKIRLGVFVRTFNNH